MFIITWILNKYYYFFYNLHFYIIGGNPHQSLFKYESERIHITGFVDSIDFYFSNCIALVVPLLLGAGIKVKVLEAMSAGVLVLTNDIGIEGIPAKDGEHYFHCESATDYKNLLNKLEIDGYSEKICMIQDSCKKLIIINL